MVNVQSFVGLIMVLCPIEIVSTLSALEEEEIEATYNAWIFFLDLCALISMLGFLMLITSRSNFLLILISFELLLLSINLSFIYWSCILDDSLGIIFYRYFDHCRSGIWAIGLALAVSIFGCRVMYL